MVFAAFADVNFMLILRRHAPEKDCQRYDHQTHCQAHTWRSKSIWFPVSWARSLYMSKVPVHVKVSYCNKDGNQIFPQNYQWLHLSPTTWANRLSTLAWLWNAFQSELSWAWHAFAVQVVLCRQDWCGRSLHVCLLWLQTRPCPLHTSCWLHWLECGRRCSQEGECGAQIVCLLGEWGSARSTAHLLSLL